MKRCIDPTLTILFVALITGHTFPGAELAASDPSPLELFEQRIMPIFKSTEPSSCVQCHLSSVDLKEYILPSHEQTFASLREQGLIDVDKPEASKILTLIEMGEQDADKGAALIHEETRQAEYEAFAAWIKASAADPQLRELTTADTDEPAGPSVPNEVIHHARKSRVVDSFVRNVWSQRMRCFPCHTPHEITDANPKAQKAIERAKNLRETYGERMDIFHETPEATIDYLVKRSREDREDELPLINLDDPAKSLFILKPTSKLPKPIRKGEFEPPSYVEPVSHMGGLKMHKDDFSYKAVVAWIQDYARVVGGDYKTADALPADNWLPTKHALFLREMPEDVQPLTTVQAFIHARDKDRGTWSEEPVAFTQGKVNPRKIAFGVLFMLSEADDHESKDDVDASHTLPPGDYLIKVFVDSGDLLSEDPTAFLDERNFLGQIEIDAKWGEGFPQAEKVSAAGLKQ